MGGIVKGLNQTVDPVGGEIECKDKVQEQQSAAGPGDDINHGSADGFICCLGS